MTETIPTFMQAIIAREPGDASVLTFAERPVCTPKASEVVLRVLSAGVNRPDIMQRQGIAKPATGATDVLGLEVCGEVVACGADVPSKWLGQRIMALVPGGGYAPWCIAPIEHCFVVPSHLSNEAAAALPEGLFTVWHNLFELGQLQMGETVLIHGGAGGIGTLAIRMAKAAGATVITTAGQNDQVAELMKMGADLAINYQTTDFTQACREFTHNRGVDVVLDIVGGPYIARNLSIMAFGGRHVSLSFMQGSAVTVELLTLMQKQLSLHSSTMRPQTHQEKARMAQAIDRHVLPLIANGAVLPRIHATLPLSQAAQAHRLLESAAVFGKLVLIP